MADGTETEYLQAKQRALLSLGLSDQTRLPSNRTIKEIVGQLVKAELGGAEVSRRVYEMRTIALELMTILDEYDPFLIGSTLSGQIRASSDIDLHAYCDDYEDMKSRLREYGYDDVVEEIVQNQKGDFCHLKWHEQGYPVEITIYPWSWRDIIMQSSITGKAMKRANAAAVRQLLSKAPI